MSRISFSKLVVLHPGQGAVFFGQIMTGATSLIGKCAKRVGATVSSLVQAWNEQAIRVAEIERLHALERARLGRQVPWPDGRWYL